MTSARPLDLIEIVLWMQLAERVGPAHGDEIGKRAPHLWQKERILEPMFGFVNVNLGRDNVVVTRENDRLRRRE